MTETQVFNAMVAAFAAGSAQTAGDILIREVVLCPHCSHPARVFIFSMPNRYAVRHWAITEATKFTVACYVCAGSSAIVTQLLMDETHAVPNLDARCGAVSVYPDYTIVYADPEEVEAYERH